MNDFAQEKQFLIKKVNQLSEFAKALDDEKVYQNIISFKDEIEKDLTFNVLCIGDFSSGKSTFINNFFIGKSLLPTSVATTTAKLTILKYSKDEYIKLIKEDGSIEKLTNVTDETLKQYVVKEGTHLEKIKKVEVFIDSDFLKEGVVIVDSPGLNDPEIERMKVTLDYVNNADSILYLFSANQAWKGNEKKFLEEKIFRKDDLDKIFFLINYWDIMQSDTDRQDVLDFVYSEMNKSIDKVSTELDIELDTPPVIPISAKTKENFEELKKVLWDYLGSKKGKDIIIAKNKKIENIKQAIQYLLNEKIDIQRKEKEDIVLLLDALKEEIEQYKKEVDEFKDRLSIDIEIAVDNWNNQIELYLRKIENIIKTKIQQNIEKIHNKEELHNYIRKIVLSVFALEEGELHKINKALISVLLEISKKEQARLSISQSFINDNLLQLEQLVETVKSDLTPEIKEDNLKTTMLTAGSVTGSILASQIFPPLGLIGIVGLVYTVMEQINQEKKSILQQPEVLDEKIHQIILNKRNEIEFKKEQVIEGVLDTIRNEIIDIYDEKKRLYEQALENKKLKEDNVVIKQYQEQLKTLALL